MKDTNNKIFGYEWSDIQAMQNGTYSRSPIIFKDKPLATDNDILLLHEKGIDYLEAEQLYGVIDRLRNSNLI